MMSQITDRYSLSPVQQGMLFHHLEAPNSGAYIQQVVFTLFERVDIPLLRLAWQQILDRHSALRTTFHCPADKPPVQNVHAGVSMPWQDFDWTPLEASRQESLFAELVSVERHGFDFSQAPLMRLTCCRFGHSESRLVWTFHHILADGRSRQLLVQESFLRYQALKDAVSLDLSDPIPYSKYIGWLEQQDFSRAKTFWKRLLQGYAGRTPITLGRTKRESLGRNAQEDTLSREVTEALRQLAVQNGLTLNTLVQAAWAFLLSRYSRENDIVFGATRACRKSSVPGSESMIGLLINTVPVRVSMCDQDSVLDCLKALRAEWLAMREHEHTPLKLIQNWSGLPAGEPLFETIVVFEHSAFETQLQSLGKEWSHRQVQLYQHTHYPLALEAYGGASLRLRLDYSVPRFDDASVQRMLGHLKNLLQEILLKPTQHPSELDLLTPEEKGQLLCLHPSSALESAPAANNQAGTLHGLFEEQAKLNPHAIAVACEAQSLTYGELNDRADRLAHRLRELGVGPEVIVGVYLERSLGLVTSLLAILKAGGAYLPIDLTYPRQRVTFLLGDAQASVVITQSDLRENLPATPSIVCIDTDCQTLGSPVPVRKGAAGAGPDSLAYVIYTSGSTGTPKGVLVTHRNVTRLFSSTARWFQFSERDVWTLFHSYAFDFSVWEMWGALLHGGKLVVVPYVTSRSPEQFYQLIAKERVTILNQTPSAFRQLIAAEETLGPRELALRFVILGGEALEIESLRSWFARHGNDRPRLINMYGITETTVHVTFRPLSSQDLNAGSVIGQPIPDLQTYILDDRMRPVPLGVPGEIYVGGAGLARGYLNRPQLSQERFIPNPFAGGRLYKTGDLARFLTNGEIEYLGRIDQQVKIRGFRIELGEIESILCTQPGVREAVVIAHEDPETGNKKLVGYVTVADPKPTASHLRESLKRQLPDYMVPAAIVALDALPLTSNGKVDRSALPLPNIHREVLATDYVPPETTVERQLAAIWSAVLRVERVGIHDNFFELGGDSILSIQLVAKARQAGLPITPRMLFDNLTIASLAGAVEGATLSTRNLEDDETGPFPLTPIQHWFFEQRLADGGHYNQTFLLALSEPLQEAAFRQALDVVKQHHGSLRLCFSRKGAHWEQKYGAGHVEFCFEKVDLSEKPTALQAAAIAETAKNYQSLLRIDAGPLSRVVHFDLGSSSPGRLLFVVHHLVIDSVSWSMLLEDLETAYRQLLEGRTPRLQPKTASFGRWAKCLVEYASTSDAMALRNYWTETTAGAPVTLPTDHSNGDNSEGSTKTLTVGLSVEETQRLLQRVPSVFNTQINDVLVTALAKSLAKWTGAADLFFNLEGHGREEIRNGVDVTRTVGWFTSIFPVRLRLERSLIQHRSGQDWELDGLLAAVKEHLRGVPLRGLSYGVCRYLQSESPLPETGEPQILFNYLGQLDSLLTGSTLFTLAPEACGPNRSPNQKRRYLLEINSAVVGGRLKVDWAFSHNLHRTETIARLAGDFLSALRHILSCCESNQNAGITCADRSQSQGDRPHETPDQFIDVYPLSPMQMLFFTLASAHPEAVVDQWQCTLEGQLDVAGFQQAWVDTMKQHSVLRSSFDDCERSSQPVQRVHSKIQPSWSMEDWRFLSAGEQATRWNQLLVADSNKGFVLSKPPLMRFALRRIGDQSHKFLWSLPALLVDGWSWPLVFRSVAQAYGRFTGGNSPSPQPVPPFRHYIDWLQKQDWGPTETFWRRNLRGFRRPTSLSAATPVRAPSIRFERSSFEIDAELARSLASVARAEQVTLSTLIQACWSIVVSRRSGTTDVVFGVSCSGRPATLPGAEDIVGPFVSHLPVRVVLDGGTSLRGLLKQIHKQSLELSEHQFASPLQIQEWCEVSGPHRLFESLVVVQNYQVDESLFRLGPTVCLGDFVGPIHSNFDLTVVAAPRERLQIELLFNPARLDQGTIRAFAEDLEGLLARLPLSLDKPVLALQTSLSVPALNLQSTAHQTSPKTSNPVPRTPSERQIVAVCEEVLEVGRLGVDDSILESGAHSLAMVKLHQRLQTTLGITLPIVRMFQYPTARSLARYLSGASDDVQDLSSISDRAHQQRDALSHFQEVREVCR